MNNNLLRTVLVFLAVQASLLILPCQGQLRNIKLGDKMPKFALADSNGVEFAFEHGRGRVLGIAFLSANQKQSKQARVDIGGIVKELSGKAEAFDFIAVVPDANSVGYFQSIQKENGWCGRILVDDEYELWGQLGIIATPTVLVVGKDDKVLSIKAGYGYDFASAVRFGMYKALGLATDGMSETGVKTLKNATVDARVKRHLYMAKLLERKGQLESAIKEVGNAQHLDPNCVETALRLGELYCKVGDSNDAVHTVSEIKVQGQVQKARMNVILGWANHQQGKLELAEKYLLEAVKVNPKSSRAYFELGKVYHARGQVEKAMKAYRKALDVVFSDG